MAMKLCSLHWEITW